MKEKTINEKFYDGYLNQLRRGVKAERVKESILNNKKFDGEYKELILKKCDAIIDIMKDFL